MTPAVDFDFRSVVTELNHHNEAYPSCLPTKCDTIDALATPLVNYIESLPDLIRLQVTTMLLMSAMRVSDRHRHDDWHGTYLYPVQCS